MTESTESTKLPLKVYLYCRTEWIADWILQDCRFVETNGFENADVIVVSLYCLLTGEGFEQVAMNRKKAPASCVLVGVLIDLFTDNTCIDPGNFDLFIHSYANPPLNFQTNNCIFVPVLYMYANHVKRSWELSLLQDTPATRCINVCYISSHPTELRTQIVSAVQQHCLVLCFGAHLRNVNIHLNAFDDGMQFVPVITVFRQSKVAIVIENTIAMGYVSEKLMLAIVAGCKVLYCGAPDVLRYVDQSVCQLNYNLFLVQNVSEAVDAINRALH